MVQSLATINSLKMGEKSWLEVLGEKLIVQRDKRKSWSRHRAGLEAGRVERGQGERIDGKTIKRIEHGEPVKWRKLRAYLTVLDYPVEAFEERLLEAVKRLEPRSPVKKEADMRARRASGEP